MIEGGQKSFRKAGDLSMDNVYEKEDGKNNDSRRLKLYQLRDVVNLLPFETNFKPSEAWRLPRLRSIRGD